MRRMWCPGVCFGLLAALALALAPAARAGDKPADEPTVVIRVKSLDAVLNDLKVLATLLGREQDAQKVQDLVRATVGAKGLHGMDLQRPVGIYVRFGKELEDINGAILVPVADQQAFLAALENLGMNPTKG